MNAKHLNIIIWKKKKKSKKNASWALESMNLPSKLNVNSKYWRPIRDFSWVFSRLPFFLKKKNRRMVSWWRGTYGDEDEWWWLWWCSRERNVDERESVILIFLLTVPLGINEVNTEVRANEIYWEIITIPKLCNLK